MEEMIACNAALCIRVQKRKSGSGVTPKGDSRNPKCRRKPSCSARARTKADSGTWRSSIGLVAPVLITSQSRTGNLSQVFNLCSVERNRDRTIHPFKRNNHPHVAFYFLNNSFHSNQRPGCNPDALSRLKICAGFSSAQSHSFPERFDLSVRDNRRKAMEGDQRDHAGKRKDPETFRERHPHKDIRREKWQKYSCTTLLPLPLHGVQRQKSCDAVLFALLGQILFMTTARVGDVPILCN